MGILNMLVSKLWGAKVTIIGHHNERLELAWRLGADRTINSRRAGSIDDVERELDEKADIVIVPVGNKEAVELGAEAC